MFDLNNNQNIKQQKICRIWFYGDNQFIRNKNNLFTLNELNRWCFFIIIKKFCFYLFF